MGVFECGYSLVVPNATKRRQNEKISIMKVVINIVIFITIFLPFSLIAQWTYLGLGAKTGTKIELVENEIYAGTCDGFYKKNLINNDTLWTLLGLQGREITDFIVFNIDTILVSTYASNMGGDTVSLFITYNNGTDWSNFQNGFGGSSEYYNCSALEFLSNAPDTIYARAGICIAKSIDRGNTWQEVFESWSIGGSQQDFIYDIDPNNPGIIWAGGETGFLSPYLLKSNDYCSSWQLITIDCGGVNTCHTLIKHPDNFNKILVGLRENIIMSLDGGESWSTIFNPSMFTSIIDMEISPNDNDLVYAVGRKVGATNDDLFFFTSEDFGVSWDTVNYQSNNISYITRDLEIINKGSNDELYFATNNGIYHYSNSLSSVGRIANQNDCSWTLYPNPMIDKTTLSFNNLRRENHTLTLQDIQGNCVRTITNITTNQVIINKDKLPNGLYIFQLRDDREVYVTGKLIIN